ncbi:MAG TPA: phosphoheptose isomerase, partial [Rhodospirillales bacterium]|nr:phosphoheptose isomerase [Rhodospirillales bacterium]
MTDSSDLNESIGEDGEHLSPLFPSGIKNFIIDIDGTITEDVPNEEPERMVTCVPFPDALATINKWYDQGHIITFLTARTTEHYQITHDWLTKHGFKFHALMVGKPRGGNYHFIDN